MREYRVVGLGGQPITEKDKSLLNEILFVEGANYIGTVGGRVYSKESQPLTYKWVSEYRTWVCFITYDHDKNRWVADGGKHPTGDEMFLETPPSPEKLLSLGEQVPPIPKKWEPPFHVDPTSGDAWVVGCKTDDTVYYTESQEKAKAVCFALNTMYAEDGLLAILDKFRRQ